MQLSGKRLYVSIRVSSNKLLSTNRVIEQTSKVVRTLFKSKAQPTAKLGSLHPFQEQNGASQYYQVDGERVQISQLTRICMNQNIHYTPSLHFAHITSSRFDDATMIHPA
jgi:hypothetical protein